MNYQNVERRLIDYISHKTVLAEGIPGLGIGDDAAFLLLSSMEEGKLVLTTDSVVENVHFKHEWCTWADVAVKLFERSCSDILAKGGHPHWALLNMNITPQFSADQSVYGEFLDTLAENLQNRHIALIGGDITRSGVNSFTLTVLGNTSVFIRRKNPEIQKGDLVVLHGKIGGSSYALDAFSRGQIPDSATALLYCRPEACWDNAWLRETGALVSIDQSDSLYETFDFLVRENRIELTVDLEAVALHDSLAKSLEANSADVCASVILKSAEDLAIAAIVPAANIKQIQANPNLHIVGVVSGADTENIIYRWNREILDIRKIPGLYEHF